MPGQQVVLRRRDIAIAFVLLTLAFVFATILVNRESRQRAKENRDLIAEIQQSRAEITYTSCLEQNARHDRTVERLDTILLQRKGELRQAIKDSDDPRVAEAIRAQIDGLDDARVTTVSLIDALAPLQNCDQITLDRFGFIPKIGGADG